VWKKSVMEMNGDVKMLSTRMNFNGDGF
jgi:hypothetical protein